MPDKDPAVWAAIWAGFSDMTATGKGALMAMLIAALRIVFDAKETHWLRVTLEACLCGALSLIATSIVHWFHLPDDAAIAAGGAIGFMGVNALREYMMRWLGKRIDG